MAAYNIETWLRGKVDYDIPDVTIMAILFDNEVAQGTDVSCTTEKQRDLCLADLLMWLSSSSTSNQGESISDNGWSHQKSAKQVTDRVGLRHRAQELYKKWDSEKAKLTSGMKITFKSIY